MGADRLETKFIDSVHHLVERSDLFVVRDHESQKLINHPNVRVVPDLTFFEPMPRSAPARERTRLHVGVNLRPLQSGTDSWIEAISRVQATLRAVPFSVVPCYDDREPLERLLRKPVPPPTLSAYRGLDAFIGTAFHSVVFAVQAGLPTVAISYHPKVRRLMDAIGLSQFAVEWNEPQRLQESIENAIQQRALIRELAQAYTYQARAAVSALSDELGAIIGARSTAGAKAPRMPLPQPAVAVLVLCSGATSDDILQTLNSLRAQTYSNFQVVLVDCPNASRMIWKALKGASDFVPMTCSCVDAALDGLRSRSSEYVTWVKAGCWFAEDAIRVLVNSLDKRKHACLSYGNCYLTHEGNINLRVSLSPHGHLKCFSGTTCFLARRKVGLAFWDSNYSADPHGLILRHNTVRLSQALLYVPYRESERAVLLAAVLFGRCRKEAAMALLKKAIEQDSNLTDDSEALDRAFQAFRAVASHHMITPDYGAFLNTIARDLPQDTEKQRKFRRLLLIRLYREMAYCEKQHSRRRTTLVYLMLSFWYNGLRWFDRGDLWLLTETIGGASAVRRLRRLLRRREVRR